MRISAISFDGCRSLPDTKLGFATSGGQAPEIILVTGGAASGKTTFLETILAAKETMAPYAGRALGTRSFVRAGSTSAKVNITWEVSQSESQRIRSTGPFETEAIFGTFDGQPVHAASEIIGLLGRYDRAPDLGKLEYFHDARALPVVMPSGLTDGPGMERFKRLTRDITKYHFVPRMIVDTHALGTEAKLRAAIERVCPTKIVTGVHQANGQVEPLLFDKRSRRSTPWSELTASEAQCFLFATTFVWAGLNDSVVFIDSPELHVGERGVVPLIEALQAVGKDNQFIMATQSPALLASVPPRQVVELP